MERKLAMLDILEAIERESRYRQKKWGNTLHSVPEWLLIMESELAEAKQGWVKSGGNDKALEETLQVIATGFAMLLEHGIVERLELSNKEGA